MFDLSDPVNVTMLMVLGFLVVAHVTSLVLVKLNKIQSPEELLLRLKSWWWIIGLLFLSIVSGVTTSIVLFGFISFLALKEFLSIVPTRQSDRRVIFWAYLTIPAQYYLVAINWYGMFVIFIPVYAFLILSVRMVLTGKNSGFIHSVGVLHWGMMLTVYSVSHVACLLVLPLADATVTGFGLMLFLIMMTQLNDVCQYLFGKLLGRRKIIPAVSPNKTWAGFIGGLASVTALAGLVGPILTPMDLQFSLMAGFIIGVSGFFGDVTISSVKRDLKIKDSGQLLPGHGGILDRIDSLMFTAPLFFHFVRYFYT
ncbi:phosphatidate cytidylyltransferase [Marinicella meishanensis]|uniref:phosphatidate cytidylyltransferase n=1 Tax=Marinicella meishanensis TaxID=2873263 RepID=UPI001CBB00E0|nr:phosphatidate cytidylyltransferase [Marinicella sp. NBU2979]